MMARISVTAAVALLSLSTTFATESSRPRLALVLSVDQARGDYLERFRPVLQGGLSRLLEAGVVFEDAHHFHATTITAPGHASLATGLHPSHSGVVGNDWFDRTENRDVYCVEDRAAPLLRPEAGGPRTWSGAGRSPKNLLGTALGDWMKSVNPETKVYSLGGKDRSAILMGGKHPDGAYWYDLRSGQWVTSRHYASEYPGWIQAFHRKRPADAHFGAKWEPIPFDTKLLDSMEVVASGAGTDDSGIPKPIGRTSVLPDAGFYAALFDSPFIDSYLLDLARLVVREERLGADENPDLLALSFSSVDAIGHAYGPNSREVLDAVVRLDRELGRFFDFLDETIGLGNVAIAMSSDHGVAPLPEHRMERGLSAGRLSSPDFECLQGVGRAFEEAFGKGDWFVAPLTLDEEVLASRGLERERAENFLARELSFCPSIARVWTRSEIENALWLDGGVDPMLELYRNGFYRDRSPDLFLQLEKWHVDRRRGTTHGSAYEYDTHVPAIVLWPGAKPRRDRERVHTVDIPVTLAKLLGVPTPSGLDGVDRSGRIVTERVAAP